MKPIIYLLTFIMLLAAPSALGKACKPGKTVDYNGVKAVVVDRRKNPSGTNRYGYIQFTNSNPAEVEVSWTVYGCYNGDSKGYKVHQEKTKFSPKSKRNQTYSYGTGKKTVGDFKNTYDYYVVSIDVSGYDNAQGPRTSKVSKDGITATIHDRRFNPDAGGNTYGYIDFTNSTANTLTVKYVIYGCYTGDSKRSKVDSGSVQVAGKKTHKEAFSYGQGAKVINGKKNQFDYYEIAIEVGGGAKTVTKSNRQSLYESFMKKHKAGTLTQSDYATGIAVLMNCWNEIKGPLRQAINSSKSGSDAALDRVKQQHKEAYVIMDKMGDVIYTAYEKGKLDSKNKASFGKLLHDVQAILNAVG